MIPAMDQKMRKEGASALLNFDFDQVQFSALEHLPGRLSTLRAGEDGGILRMEVWASLSASADYRNFLPVEFAAFCDGALCHNVKGKGHGLWDDTRQGADPQLELGDFCCSFSFGSLQSHFQRLVEKSNFVHCLPECIIL